MYRDLRIFRGRIFFIFIDLIVLISGIWSYVGKSIFFLGSGECGFCWFIVRIGDVVYYFYVFYVRRVCVITCLEKFFWVVRRIF